MASELSAAQASRIAEDFASSGGIRISAPTIALLVGAAEAVVITFGSAIGQIIYDHVAGLAVLNLDSTVSTGLLSSVVYVSMAKAGDLYRLPSLIRPAEHMRMIFAVCGFVVLGLTAILFILKISTQFSRGEIVGFFVAMLLLCYATRLGAAALIRRLMSRSAIVGSPAFLIGDADELGQLTPAYLLQKFGLREIGRHALEPAGAASLPRPRRHMQAALRLARMRHASELIVAVRWDDASRLTQIEEALRTSPLPAKLLPTGHQRAIIERCAPTRDCSIHLLDLQRAPLNIVERFAKRALDIVGASVALVLLCPTLVLVACAIVFDSRGPVIFRQRRTGFDQRQFTILKFRTMHVQEDGPEISQARRDDPRVTRVGRVLRRSSIDELPQLVNVLRGQMSLVGPRPHALAHDREYDAQIDDYCMRHHVKPGITGWAQVNGLRGETAAPGRMQQRVELDLWYIKHWSIALDLRIMLRTCLILVTHESY